MVSVFDLGMPIQWFGFATIVVIIGQLLLYWVNRRARFSRFRLWFILMLLLFLLAEIIHLRDTLRSPPQDEVLFTLVTLAAFTLFALMMHSLEEFSRKFGLASSDFVVGLRLQRALCPLCNKVKLRVPLSKLKQWKLVTKDGRLVEGITLEQLVDQGFATHPQHRRER